MIDLQGQSTDDGMGDHHVHDDEDKNALQHETNSSNERSVVTAEQHICSRFEMTRSVPSLTTNPIFEMRSTRERLSNIELLYFFKLRTSQFIDDATGGHVR